MPRHRPASNASRLAGLGLLLSCLLLAAIPATAAPGGGQGQPDGHPGNGPAESPSSHPEGGKKDGKESKGDGKGESKETGPPGEPAGGSPSPAGAPADRPASPPSPPSDEPRQEPPGKPGAGEPGPAAPAGPPDAASSDSPDSSSPGKGDGPAASPPADPSEGQPAGPAGTPADAGAAPPARPAAPSQAQGPGDPASKPGKQGTGPAAEPSAPEPVRDVTVGLKVARTEAGNLLEWDPVEVAAGPGVVQVWRLDGDWQVVAVLPSGAAATIDAGASDAALYRLNWVPQGALQAGVGALSAVQVPDWGPGLLQGSGHASSDSGLWALGALWATVFALGMVRSPANDLLAIGRQADEVPLRALFARLPGVELEQVERLEQLGLRTASQLRTLDADAISFWARLDPLTVRAWQDLAALLQWRALNPGSSRWLAQVGIRSIAQLATTPAPRLAEALRSGSDLAGAPFDRLELQQWANAARALCGIAPDPEAELVALEAATPSPAPAPSVGFLQASPSP